MAAFLSINYVCETVVDEEMVEINAEDDKVKKEDKITVPEDA